MDRQKEGATMVGIATPAVLLTDLRADHHGGEEKGKRGVRQAYLLADLLVDRLREEETGKSTARTVDLLVDLPADHPQEEEIPENPYREVGEMREIDRLAYRLVGLPVGHLIGIEEERAIAVEALVTTVQNRHRK